MAMETFKSYFEYILMGGCGIPTITLAGPRFQGADHPAGTNGFTLGRGFFSATDSLPMPISFSMPVVRESTARWWRMQLMARSYAVARSAARVRGAGPSACRPAGPRPGSLIASSVSLKLVHRRLDLRRQHDQRAVDRRGEPLVLLRAAAARKRTRASSPLSQGLPAARTFWAAVYRSDIDSAMSK